MATSSPTQLQNGTVEDSRTALEDFQALQASLEEIVSCMIRDEEQVAKQLSVHLNELRAAVEEFEHEVTIMGRLLSVAPEDAIADLRRIYEESGLSNSVILRRYQVDTQYSIFFILLYSMRLNLWLIDEPRQH
ncbi:hypothetical protein NEOLEDRAFT_1181682 [Neolentinus lepideus HHB14362 ss-1]|uniref:Uncharacterized protein n=1 Tax=Neolentinus lepideus HHB14362 ss-1 TaxID=1314782 RepID=A0A165PUG1_9AGAM|nr:hypothetical protein NEOLEDRAFT_1181682 [Neolentinus lepideus HHB14362 ss-1]